MHHLFIVLKRSCIHQRVLLFPINIANIGGDRGSNHIAVVAEWFRHLAKAISTNAKGKQHEWFIAPQAGRKMLKDSHCIAFLVDQDTIEQRVGNLRVIL